MRALIFHIVLIAGIVVPQLFIQQFWLIVLDWFLVGVLISAVGIQRVPLKSFVVELICSSLLLYVSLPHLTYLQDVAIYVEMPDYTLYLVFVVFNSINALVVTYLSSQIGKFIHQSVRD